MESTVSNVSNGVGNYSRMYLFMSRTKNGFRGVVKIEAVGIKTVHTQSHPRTSGGISVVVYIRNLIESSATDARN